MKSIKNKKNSKQSAKKKNIEFANGMIDKIVDHVHTMCDYSIDNLCIEDCYFEELEGMLYDLAYKNSTH